MRAAFNAPISSRLLLVTSASGREGVASHCPAVAMGALCGALNLLIVRLQPVRTHGSQIAVTPLGRRGAGAAEQAADAAITTLDLYYVTLVGFSTGGGEVARYIGRHGTGRVKKAVLISSVPPFMLKTADNPNGLPIEVFDGIRKAQMDNRAQLYRGIPSGPFYGFNRPGAKVSQGLIDAWWAQGMQGGHKNTYDSIAAFSATDFRADLKEFDVPTLVIHGDYDQIVPIDLSGRQSAKLIKGARLVVHTGAPHCLTDTHKDRVNQDLLTFLQEK